LTGETGGRTDPHVVAPAGSVGPTVAAIGRTPPRTVTNR
jgi:hypothetical protein